MKKFDAHIHAQNTAPAPTKILSCMENAGIYGGCIFSNCPEESDAKRGSCFEARLRQLHGWTDGRRDRLIPVLWIHPYEADIVKKIHRACDEGVEAFKIICNNFYVYEEQVLRVLREIASCGKPVFFHSGILWDGQVSSNYNKPINWEALLDIPGLRFSLAHCSWPWYDECIALYGKFQNSVKEYGMDTAEMFFDTTPGTPEIYREDLMKKIYLTGYDVQDNIMFGTDCLAHDYSVEWTKSWLDRDEDIMDRIGVGETAKEKMFHDNLMRFLGR